MPTVLVSLFFVGALSPGALMGLIAAGWLVAAGATAWRGAAGAAASGALGLGVSLYLGAQHHAAAGASACNVSEVFNCDVVNRSEFSELFGIPIAFLGSAFYGAVLLAGLLAMRRPDDHKRAGHVILAGGALSLLYSAFLAAVSAQMGVYCLMCICLYGANLILTVAGVRMARESGEAMGPGLTAGLMGKDDKTIGGMLTAGLVVFIASMAWYNSMEPANPSAANAEAAQANPTDPVALRKLYSAPAGALELDGTEPVLGSPSAPYLLVEFADFECPYCGMVFPELHDLVDQNPDLRMMFKHYPISNICNDSVGRPGHTLACGAAAATECARQQGRFWEMSELMFKNQQFLNPPDLVFMAKQAGLDGAAFETCASDPRAMEAVKADIGHAHTVGVAGTPSLYLKGVVGDDFVRVEGGPEEIRLLLQAAREGVALAPPTPAG